MMPLAIPASEISKHIREMKKKMLTQEPEMVGTSPTPDLDAQEIYDLEQKGRIEGTLMSEPKINADLTDIDEDEKYSGVGISPEQKMRMGRLRKYLDGMDMWAQGEKMMGMEGMG